MTSSPVAQRSPRRPRWRWRCRWRPPPGMVATTSVRGGVDPVDVRSARRDPQAAIAPGEEGGRRRHREQLGLERGRVDPRDLPRPGQGDVDRVSDTARATAWNRWGTDHLLGAGGRVDPGHAVAERRGDPDIPGAVDHDAVGTVAHRKATARAQPGDRRSTGHAGQWSEPASSGGPSSGRRARTGRGGRRNCRRGGRGTSRRGGTCRRVVVVVVVSAAPSWSSWCCWWWSAPSSTYPAARSSRQAARSSPAARSSSSVACSVVARRLGRLDGGSVVSTASGRLGRLRRLDRRLVVSTAAPSSRRRLRRLDRRLGRLDRRLESSRPAAPSYSTRRLVVSTGGSLVATDAVDAPPASELSIRSCDSSAVDSGESVLSTGGVASVRRVHRGGGRHVGGNDGGLRRVHRHRRSRRRHGSCSRTRWSPGVRRPLPSPPPTRPVSRWTRAASSTVPSSPSPRRAARSATTAMSTTANDEHTDVQEPSASRAAAPSSPIGPAAPPSSSSPSPAAANPTAAGGTGGTGVSDVIVGRDRRTGVAPSDGNGVGMGVGSPIGRIGAHAGGATSAIGATAPSSRASAVSASSAVPRLTACFGWASTATGRPSSRVTSSSHERHPRRPADEQHRASVAARPRPIAAPARARRSCPASAGRTIASSSSRVSRTSVCTPGSSDRDRDLGVASTAPPSPRCSRPQPGRTGRDRTGRPGRGRRARRRARSSDVGRTPPRRRRCRRGARCPRASPRISNPVGVLRSTAASKVPPPRS